MSIPLPAGAMLDRLMVIREFGHAGVPMSLAAMAAMWSFALWWAIQHWYCRKSFCFALLEDRSAPAPDDVVLARETFRKRILLTRGEHGLNRN